MLRAAKPYSSFHWMSQVQMSPRQTGQINGRENH